MLFYLKTTLCEIFRLKFYEPLNIVLDTFKRFDSFIFMLWAYGPTVDELLCLLLKLNSSIIGTPYAKLSLQMILLYLVNKMDAWLPSSMRSDKSNWNQSLCQIWFQVANRFDFLLRRPIWNWIESTLGAFTQDRLSLSLS